jgi:hypothetical protein
MSVPSDEMMKMIASQRDKASPKGAPALPADENNVISDPSQLLLSAECKQRSKRIKSRYYKLFNYFKGGKTKRKLKRKLTKRFYRT